MDVGQYIGHQGVAGARLWSFSEKLVGQTFS